MAKIYGVGRSAFVDIPLRTSDDGLGGAKASANVGSVGQNKFMDGFVSETDGVVDDSGPKNGRVDDGEVINDGMADNFRSVVKTNRSGVAKQAYRRDAKAAQHEVIGAVHVVGKRDGALTEHRRCYRSRGRSRYAMNLEFNDIYGDADAITSGSQNMDHYWATAVEDEQSGKVLVGDTDANIIVIDTNTDGPAEDGSSTITPMLAKYDSNDQFNHQDDGGEDGCLREGPQGEGHEGRTGDDQPCFRSGTRGERVQ